MKKIIMLCVLAVTFMAFSASAADQRGFFDLKGPVKSVCFKSVDKESYVDNEFDIYFTKSGAVDEENASVEKSGNSVTAYIGASCYLKASNGKLSEVYFGGQQGIKVYKIKTRNAQTGFPKTIAFSYGSDEIVGTKNLTVTNVKKDSHGNWTELKLSNGETLSRTIEYY